MATEILNVKVWKKLFKCMSKSGDEFKVKMILSFREGRRGSAPAAMMMPGCQQHKSALHHCRQIQMVITEYNCINEKQRVAVIVH